MSTQWALSLEWILSDQKNLNKQIINVGPDEEFVTINKVAEICTNLTGINLKPIFK